MHPWRDSYIDDSVVATTFPVVIEIPKGGKSKQVIVEDMLGPQEAVAIIVEALELYRKLRRGELRK